MQEELFQQSVDATKLHHLNDHLTAQLAKAEDRNATMQASITALSDDKLKVRSLICLTTLEAQVAACSHESSIRAHCDLTAVDLIDRSLYLVVAHKQHRCTVWHTFHQGLCCCSLSSIMRAGDAHKIQMPGLSFQSRCHACLPGGKVLMTVNLHQPDLTSCRLSGRARCTRARCRR